MRAGAWGLARAEAKDAMPVTACKARTWAPVGVPCAEAEGPDLGMPDACMFSGAGITVRRSMFGV